MARPNPYQMDPYLAQGFSSLTKALIGDPETDYQVARTNRVNELLPLEKQQMQAQIGGSNASAAAARALETLRQAQTLTEDELRDPRVQTEIANAKAALALAGERDANANYRDAQTSTEEALLTPRVDKTNAEGSAFDALAKARLAEAMFKGAQTATEEALLDPTVNKTNAEGAAATALEQSRLADAMFTGAQTTTEDETRGPTVDKLTAEGDAATALADERKTAAELNNAKTISEGRIILNAGQTIRTTNAAGEVETYTAPKQVEVTLEPGEEAVVIDADGVQTRIKGPAGTGDPKDDASYLEGVDAQLVTFFESDDWSKVDKTLTRRIRSMLTTASKGMDLTSAAEQIQALLSDTYKGQNVVELQGGWGDGAAFSVPGYILNYITEAIEAGTIPKASQLSKEYGFSTDRAKAVLKFLGVADD